MLNSDFDTVWNTKDIYDYVRHSSYRKYKNFIEYVANLPEK